jgi:hypothetical protein
VSSLGAAEIAAHAATLAIVRYLEATGARLLDLVDAWTLVGMFVDASTRWIARDTAKSAFTGSARASARVPRRAGTGAKPDDE